VETTLVIPLKPKLILKCGQFIPAMAIKLTALGNAI
jgi:hypothetical protein